MIKCNNGIQIILPKWQIQFHYSLTSCQLLQKLSLYELLDSFLAILPFLNSAPDFFLKGTLKFQSLRFPLAVSPTSFPSMEDFRAGNIGGSSASDPGHEDDSS